MEKFAHLHIHTQYSLLDGAARIEKLFDTCIKKNITAVAITDHGNMYGVLDFHKEALKHSKKDENGNTVYDVKPICGQEFYYAEDMNSKSSDIYHLVLLAKNMTGYQNLVKLSSEAYIRGFYYKPRIDFETLSKHSEGLICLSACLAGIIPNRLLQGDYKGAKEYALQFKKLFGEDFYIEIQDHNIREQRQTNPLLIKIAQEIGVKVVATNDVHYLEKADSEMHDMLLCIQTGHKLTDPDRMKFETDEFYLKSYDEMSEYLGWCKESFATTLEIADKCEVITFKKEPLLPYFVPPDNMTPAEYLRKLCYEGLKTRYAEITDEIKKRAEYELDVIIKMGFAEYYLIVWDFIDFARHHDIPVGAGRGSGVGSIVAYAIRITNVDPLKFSLLFERFLNCERVSNPDFDIDFCFEGRSKVIEYVVSKYGASNVCQIVTFGTMKAKQAVKDVARVYNLPYKESDTLAKMIPNGLGIHIEDVLGRTAHTEFKVNDFISAYENDEQLRKIIDMAIKIEGMPRNTSMHAAGVVICRDPVDDHVPLCKNGNDVTTQYSKDQVEELGLLKMDFLGLKTLTDVKKAKQYIKETTGNEIDFDKLGYDDLNVYELIGTGETDAVFQLEGAGMKKFMKDLKPQNMDDIIAGISLYRPGPVQFIDTYVRNKRNPELIVYDHPKLKSILEVTRGIIIYQEQVMQIVRELGGYSLGRADILRRAMSKKKEKEMIKEKAIFLHGCPADGKNTAVEGAINRGVPEDVASAIYDKMLSFASYAFNKSHAAAYAYLAYETGYLKRYYPIQFITAVINNRITNTDDVSKYLNHLKKNNVPVYQPSINKSKVYFDCQDNGVRFALMGIKGIGELAITNIVEEREKNGIFKTFDDFLLRCANLIVSKKMVENMIFGGAFDEFGMTRATLVSSYEKALDIVSYASKVKASGQFSIFDIMEDKKMTQGMDITYDIKPEYPQKDKLAYEKEVLGVYVSGHPLEDYAEAYQNISFNTSMLETNSSDDEEGESVEGNNLDGTDVVMAGLLREVIRSYDKKGKEMFRAVLEDFYGTIETVIFSSTAERYKQQIFQDNIVIINGKLNNRGDVWSLRADRIAPWTIHQNETKKIEIKQIVFVRFDEYDDAKFFEILKIAERFKGDAPLRIVVGKKSLNTGAFVNVSQGLLWELYGKAGKENIAVKEVNDKIN